ncbi:MAG: hypothetical protein WCK58_11335, partial [Chloroflexota bacterium]
MTLLRYRRLSSAPPPDRELLTVEEDGTWSGWRSHGSVVGRFAGRLSDDAHLRGLLGAVVGAPPPRVGELRPDGAWERVLTDDAEMVVPAEAPVDGAWGALLDWCRLRLEGMTAEPVAAIVATVEASGLVRLEHRGAGV